MANANVSCFWLIFRCNLTQLLERYARARTRVMGYGDFMKEKVLCGAKTRAGKPCIRKALANGRCPNHGGLSTGPKTAEGKARSLANLMQNR